MQKRRKRYLRFALLIILVIALLFIIRVDFPIRTEKTENIPFIIEESVIETRTELNYDCRLANYSYNFIYDEYFDDNSGFISPACELTNLEDQPGTFEVQLAFYNTEIYPFEEYQGKEYQDFADRLTWDAADMHSERMSYTLKAYERIKLAIPTLKRDFHSSYWTIAEVQPPVIEKCIPVITNLTVEEKIPRLDYKQSTVIGCSWNRTSLMQAIIYLLFLN